MRDLRIVVVGCSAGGLHALQVLLGGLPAGFRLPVVVVQHRGRDSDGGLTVALQRASSLPVSEPEDKSPVDGGHVYLAPPDYHLLIEGEEFALSVDEPILYSRPSIDVTFLSAVASWGARVIGVLLTGANQDGTRGMTSIRQAGGFTIAEDPATAESPTMPASAVAAGVVDRVARVERIAPLLAELAR